MMKRSAQQRLCDSDDDESPRKDEHRKQQDYRFSLALSQMANDDFMERREAKLRHYLETRAEVTEDNYLVETLTHKRQEILEYTLPPKDRDYSTNMWSKSVTWVAELAGSTDHVGKDYPKRHAIISHLLGTTSASIADQAGHSGPLLRSLWESIQTFSGMMIDFVFDYWKLYLSKIGDFKDENAKFVNPFQKLFRVVFMRENDEETARASDLREFLSTMIDLRKYKAEGTPIGQEFERMLQSDFYKRKEENLKEVQRKVFIRYNGKSRAENNDRKKLPSDLAKIRRAYPFFHAVPYEVYLDNESTFKLAFDTDSDVDERVCAKAREDLAPLSVAFGVTMEELQKAHALECRVLALQTFFYENVYRQTFHNNSVNFNVGAKSGMQALIALSKTHSVTVAVHPDAPEYKQNMTSFATIGIFHRMIRAGCDFKKEGVGQSSVQIHHKIDYHQVRIKELVEIKFHIVVLLVSYIEKCFDRCIGSGRFEPTMAKRDFKTEFFGMLGNDLDSISDVFKITTVRRSNDNKNDAAPTDNVPTEGLAEYYSILKRISEIAKNPTHPDYINEKCALLAGCWKDKSSLLRDVRLWEHQLTQVLERVAAFIRDLTALKQAFQKSAQALAEQQEQLTNKQSSGEVLSVQETRIVTLNVSMHAQQAMNTAVAENPCFKRPSLERVLKNPQGIDASNEKIHATQVQIEFVIATLQKFARMLEGAHTDSFFDFSIYFFGEYEGVFTGPISKIRKFEVGIQEQIPGMRTDVEELEGLDRRLDNYFSKPIEWTEEAFATISGAFFKACLYLGFNHAEINPSPIHMNKCVFTVISKAVVHSLLTICHRRGVLLFTDNSVFHATVVSGENEHFAFSALSSGSERDLRINGNLDKFARMSSENWLTCMMLLRVAGSFLEVNDGRSFEANHVQLGGKEHFTPSVHSSILFARMNSSICEVRPRGQVPNAAADEYIALIEAYAKRAYPSRIDWQFEDIDLENSELLTSLWALRSNIFHDRDGFIPCKDLQTRDPKTHSLYAARFADAMRLRDSKMHFENICENVEEDSGVDPAIHGSFPITP
jgi:hypothetical protein